MKLRSALLPIALAASGLNVIASAFTAGGLHALAHAAFALGFGLWAQRLWLGPRRVEPPRAQPAIESPDRMQLLEAEVGDLQRQLNETQKGLEFAERLLAQRPDARDKN